MPRSLWHSFPRCSSLKFAILWLSWHWPFMLSSHLLADPDTAKLSVKVLPSQLDPFFSFCTHVWASSDEKFNYHLISHSSPLTPDVPPVLVKSLLSTSAEKFRSQLKLSVTNRATSDLLSCPNTTSCLVTIEVTTLLLFLSLHLWRQPWPKYSSKTQPCPSQLKLLSSCIIINETSFSSASKNATLPNSNPFRIFL